LSDLWILSATRTPIGKFGGSLAKLSAVQMGVVAVQAALQRASVTPEQVDLCIVGLARQAGCGPNPGRQISVKAGIPVTSPAYTLNQACASGLSALLAAARHIAAGEAEVVVAAGSESMSNVPYLAQGVRWGTKMGHRPLVDAMYQDGLLCPLCDKIMGETVEALAQELNISRQQQDEYALQSQLRAAAADFSGELCEIPGLTTDEHARASTTMESLGKLAPVFSKTGTVTAGNASGITDGASALVIASDAFVKKHNLQPLARYLGGVVVGLEPARMGLGPVPAIQAFRHKHGSDFQRYEINEAFAAQVLACQQDLKLDPETLNVKGGSIAIGHPIGCSGARITTTLLHGLRERGGGRGLASLCVSGGLGICAGFEV
jgi:acetyl-CoA C-acetyltransferase